jgi:hypothetical protein
MNHRLEKAAHWYRPKRFGFIPEPEHRAGSFECNGRKDEPSVMSDVLARIQVELVFLLEMAVNGNGAAA